jgi:hypothetical protein
MGVMRHYFEKGTQGIATGEAARSMPFAHTMISFGIKGLTICKMQQILDVRSFLQVSVATI